MSKPIKKCRIRYRKENDAFYLETWDEEYKEYAPVLICSCMENPHNKKMDVVNCVILTELNKLIDLGYTLVRE